MNFHQKALEEFKRKNFIKSIDYVEKIIEKNPNSKEALNFRGILNSLIGYTEKAKDDWKKAISIDLKYLDPYINLANINLKLNNKSLSIKYFEECTKINPKNFDIILKLSELYIELNDYKSAKKNIRLAQIINKNHFKIYLFKGIINNKIGSLKLAVENFQKSIELNSKNQDTYYYLGITLREMNKFYEAKKYFDILYQLNPSYEYLKGSILTINNNICEWENYNKLFNEIKSDVLAGKKSISPWASFSIFDDEKLQLEAAKTFSFVKKSKFVNFEIKDKEKKKINIGYYSANFSQHAVSNQIRQVLSMHNRTKFNIFGFNLDLKIDKKLKEIKKNFNEFYDVGDKSEDFIINLSKKINIDIAIDLMGFTKSNKYKIFEKRCAPIQINYLGYSGTTSLENMDYILADKIVINSNNRDYFSENVIFMPNSFMPSDTSLTMKKGKFKKSDLFLPDKSFIYCCFNKIYKVNPQIFNVWLNILKNVKNSVLWLNYCDEIVKKNIFKIAKKNGVTQNRIIFSSYNSNYLDYLSKISCADLFLDTYPFSSHSTCSAALWAEVPVLTIAGRSFSSKVAASMLNSINLNELITHNAKDYEKLAVSYGLQIKNISYIKNKLVNSKYNSPLFDTSNYTKKLEEAYSQIYQNKIKNSKNISDIYIN